MWLKMTVLDDWKNEIDAKLLDKINTLDIKQLREIVIYFCGYQNGEDMVRDAIQVVEEDEYKRLKK
jgi:hypothetical protein